MHAENFKIANHGDLGSASIIVLAKDNLEVNDEQILLKIFSAVSQAPYEVYNLGDKVGFKAVLISTSSALLSKQMNTDVTGTGIIAIPDRDISFREINPDGNKDVTMTYMQCKGNLSKSFNNKDVFYLPVELEPTYLTQVTIEEVS